MLPHTFSRTHANALETNYQSGVSSYIYLGQWGANKHFSFLFCFFSVLPSVCVLCSFHFCLAIFFPLSLSVFLPSTRYCWGKSFTGCVQCHIQWKTARDKAVKKKRYAALQSDRNKGVVLCQATAASFTQGKWSQQSCCSLSDVVANKKVHGLWPPVCGSHKTNNHQKSDINKTQSEFLKSKVHHMAFPNLRLWSQSHSWAVLTVLLLFGNHIIVCPSLVCPC